MKRMIVPALAAGGVLATALVAAAVARRPAEQAIVSQTVPARAAPQVRAAPPAAALVAPTPAATPDDADAYVIKRVLPIDGPMRIGDHHWDEAGVPPGQLVITVDLAAQVISVFRGGYEIGAAAILYGSDAKPTPLGIYPITEKDADHVSNIYHAPMPYMLRLTNDGVAIHASEVEDGYMTHGCIGVPLPFARRLFAAAKLGDRVIITRGERLAVGRPITAA